jgi:hypothetical protein
MYRDTTKWVWTSTSTSFNKKGFEVENKDPLNRYNAGIYGYNAALPVAVVQNAQYRESAFEGFEDYSYISNNCDTLCPVGRHFDFGLLKAAITQEEKHSGKYSLKVTANSLLGVGVNVNNTVQPPPSLQFNLATDVCSGTYLQSIRTNTSSILPVCTPLAGSKIVFSAWVKEKRDCKCENYTGNQVQVGLVTATGSNTFNLIPQGNIIEGWQRYESVIDIPADASQLNLSFKATGSSDVYFDDIRIHPYHANMKSYVYHPVNLRLMAELDENNYATFYEYDDDGTLIRVKKETQRGIKTIKETRSALRLEE